MNTLPTWDVSRGKQFSYEGSVKLGTKIIFGRMQTVRNVSASQYAALLQHFAGLTVKLATIRDKRAAYSLGAWIKDNGVTSTAIASYVGPILVAEGYAEKAGSNIRFF